MTQPIEFDYVNHQGKQSRRKAIPRRVFFGQSPYHQGAQFFLDATCLDRGETRYFALKDMSNVSPADHHWVVELHVE